MAPADMLGLDSNFSGAVTLAAAFYKKVHYYYYYYYFTIEQNVKQYSSNINFRHLFLYYLKYFTIDKLNSTHLLRFYLSHDNKSIYSLWQISNY